MKDQILKIAGVKSEKEFYSKYPTEEAFQKAHGKEFKKAKLGAAIVPKAQKGLNFDEFGANRIDKEYGHDCAIAIANEEADRQAAKAQRKIDKRVDKINARVDARDAADAARASANAINMRYSNIGDKLGGSDYKARKQAYNDFVKANPTFAKDPSYTGQLSPEERYTLLDNTVTNMRRDRAIPNSYRDRLTNKFNISDPSKIGVSEMSNYANAMGGADKFREWYDAGGPEIQGPNAIGPRMQKYGGETKKLNQLTNFTNDVDGIMPTAQDGSSVGSMIGSYIGGEAPQVKTIPFHDLYTGAIQQASGMSLEDSKKQASIDPYSLPKPDWSSILHKFGEVAGKAQASARYGRQIPQAQVGTQLDMWGNPLPITQQTPTPTSIYNPQVPVIGGNAPAGGSMPNPNLNTQNMLWGTSGSLTQAPVLGGTTPASIQGMNTQGTFGKSTTGTLGKLGGLPGILNTAGDILGGIQQLGEEKKQLKKSEANKKISELTLQASGTRPEQIKRKYVRPEDQVTSANQMFPTYGVGTNYLSRNGSVLRAEGGMQVGGNPGEIQNTYAPNNLYDDLGYEPLSDSDIIKQYRAGGFTPRAQSGFSQFASAGGTDLVAGTMDAITGGSSGGGKIGGAVGGTAGMLIGGPVGQLIGKGVGTLAGNLIDQKGKKIAANQKATQQNVQQAALQSGAQTLQAQNAGFMEDGGWVSHDWQPQVITQFGEHSMKDLLKRDPMMDTLRTGGHITQNNMFPTDQYALGGELKTTWGGYAEPVSHNPYLPGTGETVMFRGKSHEESDGNGHTGIGVKYGQGGQDSYTDYAEYGSENADADVEVERGEPAMEMIDGETGEKNMVVFGNLQIPNQFLDQIGDVKAKGKKFKNYVADLGKIEEKQNKIVEKSTNDLDGLDVYTPFDKLKFDALQANINGANMKLKEIALNKSNAAAVQNAINDTAAEYMVDADHLAKGKIKIDKKAMKEQQARFGKEIFKAQTGTTTTQASPLPKVSKADYDRLKDLYDAAQKAGKGPAVKKFQEEYYKLAPEYAEKIIKESEPSNLAKRKGYTKADLQNLSREALFKTNDDVFGDRTKKFFSDLVIDTPPPTPTLAKTTTTTTGDTTTATPVIPVKPNKYSPWIGLGNQVLEYLRPTDQEGFDYAQLYPEMAAISMNQLDPVQAQMYHPELSIPYDISLQDQMNANQADFNAIQRQTGYNPAAQASIAAQKYKANSSILGEQFRLNQAEKARVYEGNRAVLNDAQLKNLGILDTQMVRQETAKSKTKEQALEIMKSMADKIAKNKLENRQLGIYENLYKYRFDANGRAVNMNPLSQFDIAVGSEKGSKGGGLASGLEFTYDANGNIIGTRKSKEEAKNGTKLKKESRNGNIVKAIKNL